MDDRITDPHPQRSVSAPETRPAPPDHPVATSPLSHESIAQRAYEIYVRRGCPPNQCDRNWAQAQHELCRELETRKAKNGEPPGVPASDHSEMLNGKRPATDARLIADIRSAPSCAAANTPVPRGESDENPPHPHAPGELDQVGDWRHDPQYAPQNPKGEHVRRGRR
jgi:hypothetical protein